VSLLRHFVIKIVCSVLVLELRIIRLASDWRKQFFRFLSGISWLVHLCQ